MNNKEVIQKFYTSFADGDLEGMLECYHDEVVFQDPAFGRLEGERVFKMWEMLLSQKSAQLAIRFDAIKATADSGKANWVAEYFFGKKKRKVLNAVHAQFKFKEGKIIAHTDTFSLWKWASQALGLLGMLLGWTPFMKKKIQATTNKRLDAFIAKMTA